MDYVEFVEFVLRAYTDLDRGGAIIGTEEIAAALNLEGRHDGVYNAVEDLQRLGVVGGEAAYIKAKAFSEQVAEGAWALRMVWPRIFARPLTTDQEAFLAQLVEIAHQPGDVSADVEMKGVLEVYSALGWTPSTKDPYRLSEALDEAGFIKSWPATGNDITLRPTYAGMVRVTRLLANEWQQRLEELRSEGETTTVDFKRELKVDGDREKGEFVRDVLGLATTKASGRDRYLLIGFEDATGAFVQDVGPDISRDRLEQIHQRVHRSEARGGLEDRRHGHGPSRDRRRPPRGGEGAVQGREEDLEARCRQRLRAPRHSDRGTDPRRTGRPRG